MITWGAMTKSPPGGVDSAADGISAELIDLRSLVPSMKMRSCLGREDQQGGRYPRSSPHRRVRR